MIAWVRDAEQVAAVNETTPNHDNDCVEDLAQLSYELKRVHPQAMVWVKLVAGAGVVAIPARRPV